MKIIKITDKITKTGKNYQQIEVEENGNIIVGSMWSKTEDKEGDTVDWNIVKKDNFINFYPKTEVKKTTTEERLDSLEKSRREFESRMRSLFEELKSDLVLEATGKFTLPKDLEKINQPHPILKTDGTLSEEELNNLPF